MAAYEYRVWACMKGSMDLSEDMFQIDVDFLSRLVYTFCINHVQPPLDFTCTSTNSSMACLYINMKEDVAYYDCKY